MPLRLEEKQALVAEVRSVAERASACIGAEYRGLSVEQMNSLRRQARAQNVYVKVVKNTLARRALQDTGFECLRPALVGPLVLAFSHEEPSAAARIFREFAKENEKLAVTALAIEGRLLPATDLDRLADLPTRPEALARLAGVLKAPLQKLVRTLSEPQAMLVRAVAEVRDQKQAA